VAVVPEGVPHQVRNTGATALRFVAVYASPDVVTRYDDEVQPDGSRERHTSADRRRAAEQWCALAA
jgi:oxalate decarboxylase/phosphoglucose isomerase-like protein (cupin superfamily)